MRSVALLIPNVLPQKNRPADFRREVIYQIVVDRFFDGNPDNNNPTQSAGLYDATKSNWRTYWGGDLEGVRKKLPYLAGLGITAIWISPPIEEHFGNSWTDFDNLVTTAHQNGIKVIVDFSVNHTTQNNAGEFGALYDNGKLIGNYTSDSSSYFNHNRNITGDGWDDRYQVQYFTLFDLSDLNPEHAAIDAYLKSAAQLFLQHGVDGFRLDAVKHVNWGWQYSLPTRSLRTATAFFSMSGTRAIPLIRSTPIPISLRVTARSR